MADENARGAADGVQIDQLATFEIGEVGSIGRPGKPLRRRASNGTVAVDLLDRERLGWLSQKCGWDRGKGQRCDGNEPGAIASEDQLMTTAKI